MRAIRNETERLEAIDGHTIDRLIFGRVLSGWFIAFLRVLMKFTIPHTWFVCLINFLPVDFMQNPCYEIALIKSKKKYD